MLDQDKSKDPEELITCPYSNVHNVPRKRMTKHLSKCRKQNQELAKVMVVCEFNISHRISEREYEFHKEECPDRETYYNHKFKVGGEPNEAVELLNQNILKPLHVPCTEPSWDDEVNPQQNIINVILKEAEQGNALRIHSNEPPAIRKAKREEDRRKVRERNNEEERSQFDPRTAFSSTSFKNASLTEHELVDDTASSVNAFSVSSETTIRSESDASFQSALTTATRMLDTFQVVENKRGRGRSRAPTNDITSSQIGIGRGRRRE